ncbi:MAG: serine/threonine-protein kinase [Verrucomicrobiota bacterium]
MSVYLGHYKLVSQLGKGRTTALFSAFDPQLNCHVAIMLLDEDIVTSDMNDAVSFVAAAKQAAGIKHPHLIEVFHISETKGQIYAVMEFLDGCSLYDWVVLNGRMPEWMVLKVAAQVADALRFAQAAHLIHGNINPRNIFITQSGDIKVLGLGLDKMAGIEIPDNDGCPSFCAYYIAPERVGKPARDFRSDIYSLGASLFFALTGQPPFPEKNPEQLAASRLNAPLPSLRKHNASISPQTESLIRKMLGKNPFERYLNYDSLISEIPTSLPQASPEASLFRKNLTPVIISSVTAVLLLGFSGGYFLLKNQADRTTGKSGAEIEASTPAPIPLTQTPENLIHPQPASAPEDPGANANTIGIKTGEQPVPLSASVSNTAQSETLVQWDFTPPKTADLTPGFVNDQAANLASDSLVVSPLGNGSGLKYYNNENHCCNLLAVSQTVGGGGTSNLADAITADQYQTFTVKVSAGHTLSISAITLQTSCKNYGENVGTSYLLCSLTGFEPGKALGSGSNGAVRSTFFSGQEQVNYIPWTVDLSTNSSFQNLTSANGVIEFRVYEPMPSWLTGGLQTLTITGTVK